MNRSAELSGRKELHVRIAEHLVSLEALRKSGHGVIFRYGRKECFFAEIFVFFDDIRLLVR